MSAAHVSGVLAGVLCALSLKSAKRYRCNRSPSLQRYATRSKGPANAAPANAVDDAAASAAATHPVAAGAAAVTLLSKDEDAAGAAAVVTAAELGSGDTEPALLSGASMACGPAVRMRCWCDAPPRTPRQRQPRFAAHARAACRCRPVPSREAPLPRKQLDMAASSQPRLLLNHRQHLSCW